MLRVIADTTCNRHKGLTTTDAMLITEATAQDTAVAAAAAAAGAGRAHMGMWCPARSHVLN